METLGYDGNGDFAIVDPYSPTARQESQVVEPVVKSLESHFGRRPPEEMPGVG